jgi:hypothetical protein
LFSSHHENLQKLKKVSTSALNWLAPVHHVAVQHECNFTASGAENKAFLLQCSNLEAGF